MRYRAAAALMSASLSAPAPFRYRENPLRPVACLAVAKATSSEIIDYTSGFETKDLLGAAEAAAVPSPCRRRRTRPELKPEPANEDNNSDDFSRAEEALRSKAVCRTPRRLGANHATEELDFYRKTRMTVNQNLVIFRCV